MNQIEEWHEDIDSMELTVVLRDGKVFTLDMRTIEEFTIEVSPQITEVVTPFGKLYDDSSRPIYAIKANISSRNTRLLT